MVVSPALQRGERRATKPPQSRRDGPFPPSSIASLRAQVSNRGLLPKESNFYCLLGKAGGFSLWSVGVHPWALIGVPIDRSPPVGRLAAPMGRAIDRDFLIQSLYATGSGGIARQRCRTQCA